MSYPSFAKTWQLDVNNVVNAESTSALFCSSLMKTIKDILIGFGSNPWAVRYSCDATTAGSAGDLVDRWSALAKVNWGSSTRSWMVLRQTGIATNFEVCIDLNSGTTTNASIIVSPSAAFTGGTTTARPTATDETVVVSAGAWLGLGSANQRHIVHAWLSSDGQCTRVSVWTSGQTNDLFWQFDKCQNPVTGWTVPAVFCAFSGGATFTNLGTGTSIRMRGNGGTPNFGGTFTAETFSNGTQMRTAVGIGTSPSSFDDQWPVFPMGVAANAVGNAGRLANVYDLWWKPTGINNGDTFPTSLTARQLVAMGDVVLPWSGDSTVPLLA